MLALLGENGAGKSTLVSILFGHYVADEGTITAFGTPLPPGDPAAALAAGIGMVHQHFTLADNLSVLDNVLIGTEPLWQPFSRSPRRAGAGASSCRGASGWPSNPHARVADLSVGERQRVEILKALYRDARILILDEPTAVLTPQESERLFATLRERSCRRACRSSSSVHKLDEVLACQRPHRGAAPGPAAWPCGRRRETDAGQLAELMVGREVVLPQRRRAAGSAAATRAAARRPRPWCCGTLRRPAGAAIARRCRLAVAPGEIVAIAGVSPATASRRWPSCCRGLLAAEAGRGHGCRQAALRGRTARPGSRRGSARDSRGPAAPWAWSARPR